MPQDKPGQRLKYEFKSDTAKPQNLCFATDCYITATAHPQLLLYIRKGWKSSWLKLTTWMPLWHPAHCRLITWHPNPTHTSSPPPIPPTPARHPRWPSSLFISAYNYTPLWRLNWYPACTRTWMTTCPKSIGIMVSGSKTQATQV